MLFNKKITRTVAVLLIVALTVLSMTACSFDFSVYPFDENIPGFGDNFGYGEQGNGNNGGNNDGAFPGFYPGSGQGGTDAVDPLSKALLSTVTIVCNGKLTSSAGSGVIYSIDKAKGNAYIITNQHVVYGESNISVYLYGMHLSAYAIPARFIGGSIGYDLAVLKIEDSEIIKNSYACAINFADSEGIRVFDRVYAVGNSEGNGISATEGIVSVATEDIRIEGAGGNTVDMRVMRVDAAVNHGNSGGGLYDEQGKLVGIVAAKEVSEDIDNMGYAIPSNLVKSVVESILRYCDGTSVTQIRKAVLGITITSRVGGAMIDENGKVYTVEQVEVVEVSKGAVADGKVMVGDIIKSITVDGVKCDVTRRYHVTDAMISAKEGSVVVLNLLRDGADISVSFRISASSLSVVK